MSRNKFRWTLEGTFPAGKFEPAFVKVHARPNIVIEDNHDSDKPAKPTDLKWQNITTTFYDCKTDENWPMWKIISSCYDLSKPTEDGKPIEVNEAMAGELKLNLLCPHYTHPQPSPEAIEANKKRNEDLKTQGKMPIMGIGSIGMGFGLGTFSHWEMLEEWTLKNCWPTQINFGELDHSSSEECTLEITWRYKEVFYKSHMPVYTQPCEPSKD